MGQPFMAMSAGPLDPFNHAVSFTVECDDQREIDRLWDALGDGGKIEHAAGCATAMACAGRSCRKRSAR